ncbi:efflux RND transporter permease subunit [Paracoccus sp. M683]|uniref:efflux RND transporter permease subunit n=1 Tax=Paracoccus sp. M683 TaxID=2594268 RepID=UPI00117D9F16|nr:efflux RND transporter permease subunit [Paracoccus sp. M683]TRW99319.1 efflux RND transporter permease subunit [Paracoccus sp. M683]
MAEDGGSGRGILSLFTRHATLANLVLAVMVVGGLVAAPRMRAQFFPDTVIEQINISVQWDGAGAEDVDRSVIAVLEPALLAVEGVAAEESRATQGAGRIELEFEPGWDMSRAMTEVETAISTVDTLPEGAEDPEISRGAWRDRVADVVISGPVGVDQLGRLADDLLNRLYARGITRATVSGLTAPETLIEVSMADLVRHDLTMEQIAQVAAAAASAQPAGDVSSGAARVRTGSEARDPASVAALPLRLASDGTELTVGDVARVTSSGMDREVAFYVGSDPAVVIQVMRSAAGDAIGMQREVEAAAAEMRPSLPDGVAVELVRARAEQISGRLQILVDNAIMGLGLVVCLLFLFLNARTALWVAAGIPASLLSAIGLMYLFGMTLNMISLFALILTLGIIVDDAIVVGEHADYRARKLGERAVVAAERAAYRMAAPVVSSTLTTIIAFGGLMAIGGRFGNLIVDIPLTVIMVLAASLIECFLVLPNHMAHALTKTARNNWYDKPSKVVNRGLDWLTERFVRPVLGWIIRLRYPVLAATIALFGWSAAAMISGQVPWRFWDSPEHGSVAGNFAMLPGATRDDTMRVLGLMQDAVDEVAGRYQAEYGTNPVTHAMAQIGGNSGRPLPGADTKDADLLGSIQIELIDADLRPYSSFDFVADLQQAMPADPRLETISFRGFRGGPGGDAISVRLSGADAQQLKNAAEALKARLAAFPEVLALEDSMSYDKEELALELTAQGRALGFTTEGLARELRQRLGGIEAASFPVGTRTGTIQVELPESERRGDFLDRMMMRATSGQWVPLADIVTVGSRAGFSTIRRENGVQMISVTGDLSEGDPARAAEITQNLENVILPQIASDFGVDYEATGLAEQERDFLGEAALGFALAMLGIYMVLAWIFASWTRPLVVMAVIPFGLIGAVWGHTIWGLPMSMFSIVGLIGMSGIVINDSIVLISTVDEYAASRGMRPAIIDAVCNRLRPVLLTTLTTVLGLAPLLYERSSQALFLKPTVVTLAYGLGFGMLVVLLVVPAALGVGEDIAHARRGLRRGLRAGPLRLPLTVGALIAAAGFVTLLLPVALAQVLSLPGWWPVAASAGQAMAWYMAAVVLAVVVAGGLAISRSGRSPASASPADHRSA